MIEIDKLLEQCGDFHRYQYILLVLFSIINMLSAMHYYSQTIISFEPPHWCYDQRLENSSITRIREIYSEFSNPSCTALPTRNDSDGECACKKWSYDLDYGYKSMTSDLNWVCDSAWKSTLGQSMFFIGSVFGSLGFGIASDKVGRVPCLIISNVMAMVGNLATIFSTSVPTFSFCRFISGLATDSNFVMMYILALEYIRPAMRTIGLNLCIGIFYCLGSVITPWIAVAVGNWQLFLLTSALPIVVVPFFYFLMSESAQWLITKKRYSDAVKCLKWVAAINGKHVEDKCYQDLIVQCTKSMETKRRTGHLLGLFKSPRLRRNTLIIIFKSMVITLSYDAISRNVEGLGISPLIMFSLSATAILPACLILMLLQDKIGRKAMASSALLVSGLFTMATGIFIVYQLQSLKPNTHLLVCLSIIGRFGVTIAYNSAAQYATELIPTCVRGQGVAAVHVAGFAASFFSSYILFLQNIFKPLPFLILGGLSLIGAILCLFLPETLNRALPNTLEDGEEFGRGEPCFHFSCFENQQKPPSTCRT